jgi:hypothetical protein
MDYRQHIDMLSDKDLGKLFRALFDYVESGTLPSLPPASMMAFSFIRVQMDRDWEQYMAAVETRRENGKLGGRPKKEKVIKEPTEEPEKPNGYLEKPKKPNGYFEKPNITEPYLKKHDNGTVNGTDNVNDNGTVFSTAEKPGFSLPTLSEISEYFSETHCTIDPERFFNYYQKKNWIGNDGLVIDWKKALAGWESREGKRFEVKHTAVRKKRYEGLVE